LNFEERYTSSAQVKVSLIYNPVRHSNAVIESYFRTVKNSIYQGKVDKHPSNVIMELYQSVQAQLKPSNFQLTQSSKGRKRQKKSAVVEEKWSKKVTRQKRRTIYLDKVDKFISKRARSTNIDSQSEIITKKIGFVLSNRNCRKYYCIFSESEETTTVSSLSNHSNDMYHFGNDNSAFERKII
jgi:hypothetical protein